MQAAEQQEFHERCDALDNVEIITFNSHIELLMQKAVGIVAMGGYNTFCEILTLDKPALIIPRSVPRQEQLIRAERAVSLGLVSMLNPAGARDVLQMTKALQSLPDQPKPSSTNIAGLLAGHARVAEMVRCYLEPDNKASVTG
jgi:predicted glycosyltransferase